MRGVIAMQSSPPHALTCLQCVKLPLWSLPLTRHSSGCRLQQEPCHSVPPAASRLHGPVLFDCRIINQSEVAVWKVKAQLRQ